jgi:hypothetical protein
MIFEAFLLKGDFGRVDRKVEELLKIAIAAVKKSVQSVFLGSISYRYY